MEQSFIEVKSNGTISAKQGRNTRSPHEHQKKAMESLDIIDEAPSYSTLVRRCMRMQRRRWINSPLMCLRMSIGYLRSVVRGVSQTA